MSLAGNTVALMLLLQAKDETGSAMKSVNDDVDKLESRFGKLSGLGKGVFGAVTGGAGAAAIGILSDAARAAADDEASVTSLKKAVENSGAAWDDHSSSIDAAIKKGQELAFTDDQTRGALQMLTEETGSVDEAMARLPATMDLARAKHIDLEAAAKLLGKVNDENVNGLKKLGITMDAGATATDVLAKVQDVAGGQAEAYGKSTKGMIDKTKDAFAEWKESIGAATGPAMGIIALLPGLSGGMTIAGTAIGGLSTLIRMTAIPSLLAMAVPFLPIILVIGAIGVAVGLLALAWSNNWGDIQGKTKAAIDFIGGILEGLKMFLAQVGLALIGIVRGAIGVVTGILNTLIDAWNAVAEHLHLPILGRITVSTPGLDAAEAALNEAARPRTVNLYPVAAAAPQWWGITAGAHPQAEGGDYMVNSPTLFLAGEAGPERATFQPLGSRASAGGGVLITGNTFNVREDRDIERIGLELYRMYRMAGGRV